MPALTIVSKGDFSKTFKFLERAKNLVGLSNFDKFGRIGVEALRDYTPKSSGKTADSWYYEIEKSNSGVAIIWKNSNVNKGFNVAVGIQYGHGTGNGGYVRGVDYINPAMQPVFEKIAEDLWREVTR